MEARKKTLEKRHPIALDQPDPVAGFQTRHTHTARKPRDAFGELAIGQAPFSVPECECVRPTCRRSLEMNGNVHACPPVPPEALAEV